MPLSSGHTNAGEVGVGAVEEEIVVADTVLPETEAAEEDTETVDALTMVVTDATTVTVLFAEAAKDEAPAVVLPAVMVTTSVVVLL